MSLCDHNEFIAGNVHTDFIPMHKEKLFESLKTKNVEDEIVCCSMSTLLNSEADLLQPFINAQSNFAFSLE